jgi:hypothetical protein
MTGFPSHEREGAASWSTLIVSRFHYQAWGEDSRHTITSVRPSVSMPTTVPPPARRVVPDQQAMQKRFARKKR